MNQLFGTIVHLKDDSYSLEKLEPMRIVGLLGLLLFVFSCQNKSLTEVKLNHPICVDSLDLFFPQVPAIDMKFGGRYRPLYVGKEQDTLFIDYNCGLRLGIAQVIPPPPPFRPAPGKSPVDTLRTVDIEWGKKVAYWKKEQDKNNGYFGSTYYSDNYRYVLNDSIKMEVVVDTNHYLFDSELSISDSSSVPVKGYPVIIKNLELDTIIIEFGRYVPLSLEEQKEDGSWVLLKEVYRRSGAERFVLLPPNEILVTTMPVYKWKERKLLRLKLGNNYSSTFIGKNK